MIVGTHHGCGDHANDKKYKKAESYDGNNDDDSEEENDDENLSRV